MSILPQKRDITALFSTGKPYYIDFYQRDYKWNKGHIEKLLEDLFYRFSLDYHEELDNNEQAISHYDWYYLNTYVTNVYNGRTFIVDGQQRFTSLSLILIKLYHLTKRYPELSPLGDFISDRIAGKTPTGRDYWMGHNDREAALEDLYLTDNAQHGSSPSSDLSIKNMYQNYTTIDQELGGQLTDSHRLEAFSLWFLQRVMLVQIEISETQDVPMVFEVINDRGERLKPYEVLKGKLLGQIAKEEIETYHPTWQKHVYAIQNIDEDYVDDFFRTLFRSRYISTHAEYREFDGDYHKTIYEPRWNKAIKLKQNPLGVKRFITNDLSYYADLYVRIMNESQAIDSEYGPYLYYNYINGQDRQALLILSACSLNDAMEREKIELVSRLFDKHFSLLQLTNSYDSNSFTESLITLTNRVRNRSVDEIDSTYHSQIIEDISKAQGAAVTDPYDWNFFKDAGRLTIGEKFVRYFFARVDRFIASETGIPTADFYNTARNTGPVYGFHIEHILAHNDENRTLFGNDEELFRLERNRLGALLLLRGKDNEASSNEPFMQKVRTYAGSLLWNQTLHPDFYHNKKGFLEFNSRYGLGFKPYEVYDKQAIDERQLILLKLVRLMWP